MWKKQTLEAVLQKMAEYWSKISHDDVKIAAALDGRMKKMQMPGMTFDGVEELIQLKFPTSAAPKLPRVTSAPSHPSSIFQRSLARIHNQTPIVTEGTTLQRKLRRYFSSAPELGVEDIVAWWAANRGIYPRLSKVGF